MKKKLSYFLIVLSLLLSHMMCIVVAYSYCNMTWCIKQGACSAPAEVSFMYAIPYVIGIIICGLCAYKLYKE